MKNKHSLLKTSLLVLLLVFSFEAFSFSGGSGTESDPYLVGTVAELLEIKTLEVSKYVKLTADIDFAGEDAQTAFDNEENKLSIFLDGDGFVIKNITINGKGFATELIGSISNLGFDNITVHNAGGSGVLAYGTAVIAGHTWSGKVLSCFVTNSTVSSDITGSNGQAVGVLVGAAMGANVQIDDCYTDNVTVTGRIGVAGLVGRLHGNMSRCAAYGGVLKVSENTDQADGKGIGYVGPVTGDTWKETTFSMTNNYYNANGFEYYLADVLTTDFLSKLNDGTTDIATPVTDLTVQASFVGFDFENVWVMGNDYPLLGEPVESIESLVSVVTDKHNGLNSPVGGTYAAGDSIEFKITYNSNSNSKLSIVLKEQPGFVTAVMPKLENIDLPNTTEETTITVMVGIPDTVSYEGQIRIGSWLGSWSAEGEIYEYIVIGEIAAPIEELTRVVTDKHNGDSTIVGGYYLHGDSIAFEVTYNSNSNSKLSIVLKEQPGFVNQVIPKLEDIVLPNTTEETTITVMVGIPDTVSYVGAVRVGAWLGAWSAESELFEYIYLDGGITSIRTKLVEQVNVYPNPSAGLFNITLKETSSIVVYNLSGQSVLTQDGVVGVNSIDLYDSGTYILNVTGESTFGSSIIFVK